MQVRLQAGLPGDESVDESTAQVDTLLQHYNPTGRHRQTISRVLTHRKCKKKSL